MRRANVMFLAAVLLMAGFAAANTVWNPAGNPDPNVIVNGASNWNIPANWTLGLPGLATDVPPRDPKAVLNVLGAPECQVTDTQVIGTLVIGDNGEVTQNNVLRVMDGGNLTCGASSSWMAVGYNRPGTLIVEKGGVCNFNCHMWFGLESGAAATIILNGGTIIGRDAIDLGRNGTATGKVYINSGLLQARYITGDGIGPDSLVDIRFGTWKILGNRVTQVNAFLTQVPPRLVGFGGAGTIDVALINGDTYVTAISPMNPSPSYGATVPEGLVDLAWTNIDPNTPGDPVYVDVWFGTDPDKLSLAYSKVVTGTNATTVTVNAPVVGTAPTKYYWQVDSYIYGTPTGEPIEGDVFTFDVTNDFPPTVVIETPDTVTWTNEPVQLNATVSDTGTSPLTITWTANNANVAFSPSANVEDPVVTVNPASFPATVTLTCSVKDALNSQTNTDTMVLEVYADACLAGRDGADLGTIYPMDVAAPFCVVNIADLVVFADDWLTDYTLTVPTVIP